MKVKRGQRIDPKTGKVIIYFDVSFYYETPVGEKGRERKRLVGVSEREALHWGRDRQNARLNGTYGRKEKKEVPTLEAFKNDFLENYVYVHNKPSEQRNKEKHLDKHLVPFFGTMRLDEIGSREMDRYAAYKQKLGYRGRRKDRSGIKAKTINSHLSTLSRLLTLAFEWELIDRVPPIRKLKEDKPKFKYLDFDEAKLLQDAAEPEWSCMIVTGLKTGLRVGELLALRWEDVDLVAKRIIVRHNYVDGYEGTPKSGKNRVVDLCDEVVAVLGKHRHIRGRLVFCKENGDYLTKHIITRPLWRACKLAGIERVSYQVLRHTFASHLAMRGAPAKAIQELMGHASIETTNRYMHLSPIVRQDVVKLLDNPSGELDNNKSMRKAE